jgi:hypothetical protein
VLAADLGMGLDTRGRGHAPFAQAAQTKEMHEMNRANIRAAVAALACALALLVGTATGVGAQRNNQGGLVNVNLQDLQLVIPVSVAVPIGIAANVCDVNVATIREQGGRCTAENNSFALSRAIADAALDGRGGGGGGGGSRNNQNGLVNVNVQDLQLVAPVSVALPIGVAANVCDVNVLTIREQGGRCDAENTSTALSRAVARALLD